MNKILSIIVPSYNMEAYLPKCLGSLIIDDESLLGMMDVIVVNDGSKDSTSEVAHEFEKRYPAVFRVIDKPNGHYGSCINAALPMATGEYVKVLDADDYVDTTSFKTLLRVICEELNKGESAADLIVSDYVSVDPEGVEIRRSNFGLTEDSASLKDIKKGASRITIHGICYRTRNLLGIGYRQTEGCAYTDTEWIIEPMITVRRVRYMNAAVTRYLVGRDGQTMDANVLAKNFQVILDITHGLVERYDRNYAMCVDVAKDYYRQQIINMLRLCYRWGLFGYGGKQLRGDLSGFDEYLSGFLAFYNETNSFTCGPSNFPFRYVAEWRKSGKNFYWKCRVGLGRCLLLIVRLATALRLCRRGLPNGR